MIELLSLYYLIGLGLLVISGIIYALFKNFALVQITIGALLFCGILTGVGFLAHTFMGVII